MRYESRFYSKNRRYFLFTFDMLFSLIFSLKRWCLYFCFVLLYTPTRKTHRFHRVHEICFQPEQFYGNFYWTFLWQTFTEMEFLQGFNKWKVNIYKHVYFFFKLKEPYPSVTTPTVYFKPWQNNEKDF